MSGWWVAAFVAQWLLLAALAVVVVALARQVGVLHVRLGPLGALEVDGEGPPLGEAPPVGEAVLLRGGGRATIGGPGSGRLVVFVSPTCPMCREVLPGVPAAARAAGVEAVVVEDPSLEAAWGVPGTPYAVVLDELGVVRSKGTVNSMEQLEGLLDTARQRVEDDVVPVPDVEHGRRGG